MLLLLLACASRPHISPPRAATTTALAATTLAHPAVDGSGLIAEGAWKLTRTDSAYSAAGMLGTCSRSAGDFGGYSGLEWSDGALLAASDRGHLLRIPLDGSAPADGPAELSLLGDCGAESIRRDGDDLWIVYEESRRVERYRTDTGTLDADVGWQDGLRYTERNTGMEAMTVLSDGRRLLLTSGPVSGADEQDSVGRIIAPDGALAGTVSFTRTPLASGGRYTPTELATLPDGRILLLERSWDGRENRARISVFVPEQVTDGARLSPTLLAALGPGEPIDNMEGLAIQPTDDGPRLWLISDDNPQANTGQDTLLMSFRLSDSP